MAKITAAANVFSRDGRISERDLTESPKPKHRPLVFASERVEIRDSRCVSRTKLNVRIITKLIKQELNVHLAEHAR